MKSYISKSGLILLSIISMSSCIVTKTYKTPEVTEKHYLFRLDSLTNNGEDIGSQSWKQFFKDKQLKQYIDTALLYNQNNRIAYKNIEIFRAQFKQDKAGYLPTLGLNANVQKTELANAPSSQDFTQYQVDGNLSWEADLWGKITSQKLMSKAAFEQSVTAQKLLQTQLISDLASTYYRLLEADKRKRILEETIVIRKESLNTLNALKEAGTGNVLAVNQAQSQLMQAEILLTSVNNQVFTLENALITLMGKPVYTLPRHNIEEQSIPKSISTGLPLEILSKRPDVKEAELGFLTAFEQHNIARTSLYPSIKLTASFGSQGLKADQLFKSGSFFNTIIGGITQPLLNGKQLKTRKKVTELQMEQRLLQFQQKVLSAGIEVSNVLQNIDANTKNLEVLTDQVALLTQSLEDAKALLDAGMVNYLDVLNAQSNLLNTQLLHASTQLQQLENSAILYRALGGGIN